MNFTNAFTSVGAIAGLGYGVVKRKPLWAIAGLTIVFAVAGAALGSSIENLKKD